MTFAVLAVSVIAYVGPGPGNFGIALIGLIATVFLALLAFFSWPIRVAIRKMRGGADAADSEDETGDGADEEE